MAEISQKRRRDDSIGSELDGSKRQKPYNNILNLLDEEQESEPEPSHELSQDLTAIFTTLQRELSSSSSTSCGSTTTTTFDFESLPSTAEIEAADLSLLPASTGADRGGGDEDESVRSVMRHLLEASDDELGIPNTRDDNGVEDLSSGENLPFTFTDHSLWELEDVAANYYTVLQSELFM